MRTFLFFYAFCSFFYACQDSPETQAWDGILEKPSMHAIDSFLNLYPDGKYKKTALDYKERFLWSYAKTESTELHYRRYLKDYPEGKFMEDANKKLDSLKQNIDPISLEDLLRKSYTGLVNYGNREVQILSLRFRKLEASENSDEVRFLATLNTTDLRKEILGTLDKSTLLISFNENDQDKVMFNLSQGRAYLRDGKILIESVDPNQPWNLR